MATVYCAAIGEVSMLNNFLQSRGQLKDAILIAQAACEGAFLSKKTVPSSTDQGMCNGIGEPLPKNEKYVNHRM